jgi:hypothetical protein
MNADDLLRNDRALILEDTWRSVVQLKHYERDGEAATRYRLEVLYDEVANAVATRDLCGMLDYAEGIAKQRFEAGFDLGEVQTAFFLLEEAIWRRALVQVPAAELAEVLGLVTTVMRRGRDAFARTYLSLATRGQAPSLDLSRLFKDT